MASFIVLEPPKIVYNSKRDAMNRLDSKWRVPIHVRLSPRWASVFATRCRSFGHTTPPTAYNATDAAVGDVDDAASVLLGVASSSLPSFCCSVGWNHAVVGDLVHVDVLHVVDHTIPMYFLPSPDGDVTEGQLCHVAQPDVVTTYDPSSDPTLLQIHVLPRSLPVSSSHAGRPFRLCIVLGGSEVLYTSPFVVFAKQFQSGEDQPRGLLRRRTQAEQKCGSMSVYRRKMGGYVQGELLRHPEVDVEYIAPIGDIAPPPPLPPAITHQQSRMASVAPPIPRHYSGPTGGANRRFRVQFKLAADVPGGQPQVTAAFNAEVPPSMVIKALGPPGKPPSQPATPLRVMAAMASQSISAFPMLAVGDATGVPQAPPRDYNNAAASGMSPRTAPVMPSFTLSPPSKPAGNRAVGPAAAAAMGSPDAADGTGDDGTSVTMTPTAPGGVHNAYFSPDVGIDPSADSEPDTPLQLPDDI